MFSFANDLQEGTDNNKWIGYRYKCGKGILSDEAQKAGERVTMKWGSVEAKESRHVLNQESDGTEKGKKALVHYLDRLDVDCGKWKAITWLKYTHIPPQYNYAKYDFGCIPLHEPGATNTEKCMKFETGPVELNNVFALKSYTVDCGSERYLQQFGLKRIGNSGNHRYEYTCCKVVIKAPWLSNPQCRAQRVQTCANEAKAQTRGSGGFCLVNGGGCWIPSASTRSEFEKAIMKSGRFLDTGMCDANPEGRIGSTMMACYGLQPADRLHNLRTVRTVNFGSYEALRTAVRDLDTWNYYAWRISGSNTFHHQSHSDTLSV